LDLDDPVFIDGRTGVDRHWYGNDHVH